MADNWQDATSQQIKLISDRLNELLSAGLNLLHSELGVDLGLKPELYPPWVILLAACIGLVLMVSLWAWACRGVFKKPRIVTVDDSLEESKAGLTKPTLEPKRKKRKTVDKKLQPNGGAVGGETQEEIKAGGERQEEIRAAEDVQHHALLTDVKPDKVSEVKKTKKKPKQAVKDVKGTADGKEPEEGKILNVFQKKEGTWETKVSNKEKREQRRKDKVPGDGSGSPGDRGSPPSITPPELAKTAAVAQKKRKGEVSRAKAEKDVITAQVDNSDAGWTHLSVKAPAQVIVPDGVQYPANQSTAQGSPEPASRWGQENEAVEPSPVTEVPWLGPRQVEDEWSGKNGETMNPSSDWDAPSEAWVNHEEPPVVEDPSLVEDPPAVAPSAQEEGSPEPAKVSDEEKADAMADGSGKSKKKKKKKKKQAEEGGGADQDGEEPDREPEVAVKKQPIQETVTSFQPASTVLPPASMEVPQLPPAVIQVPQTPGEAEPSANQYNLPAPTQKNAEESQPSKPVKKKRARRET